MLRAKILKADNIRIDTCKKWDEYSKKESYWNARNQKHHTYINNPFQQLIRRLKIAEERINELKDRVIETSQIKSFPNVRGKKMNQKITKPSIQVLWKNVKGVTYTINITGILEGRKEKKHKGGKILQVLRK